MVRMEYEVMNDEVDEESSEDEVFVEESFGQKVDFEWW